MIHLLISVVVISPSSAIPDLGVPGASSNLKINKKKIEKYY